MALFFENALSYPVFIFSALLIIVMLYWLIASLGLFDIDAFDADAGEEAIGEGLTGLLMKLGLSGVPFTLVITFITLFGWLISYFCVHLFLRFLDAGIIRYSLATVALLATLAVAVFMTSLIIRPLRPLFNKLNTTVTAKTLIGQTVEIRSASVTTEKGQANYEDGGAGMILQVRAADNSEFKRGDRAVILSYDEITHSYLIISEDEFRGI